MKGVYPILIFLGIWLLFFTSCSTDDNGIIEPYSDPAEALRIHELTTSKTQLITNGDSCQISARILAPDNNPVDSVDVKFMTDYGSLVNYSSLGNSWETDTTGYVSTTFQSAGHTGENRIYLTIGSIIDSVSVNVIPRISQVILSSVNNSVLGDGESGIVVSASIQNQINTSIQGVSIVFTSDYGTFDYSIASTDTFGVASVQFNSYAADDTLTGTIGCYVESFPDVTDVMDITIRGVEVVLEAEDDIIEANLDSTLITAWVLEKVSRQPIPNKLVSWSASNGVVGSPSVTNYSGQATTTLRSTGIGGSASVTADIGYGLSGQTTIEFGYTEAHLSLVSDTLSILANGLSQTSATAVVTDITGNPFSGVGVHFESSAGTISNDFVLTDEDGLANVVLQSVGSTENITAEVTASLNAGDSVMLSESLDFLFRGITLDVVDDQLQLIADGNSTGTISALVYETQTHNPVSATSLSWSTTLGIINGTSITDTLGQTSTTLLSISGQTGTAEIHTSLGDGSVNDMVTVDFLDESVSYIQVEPSALSILANGTDTVRISVQAMGLLDNPVSGVEISMITDRGFFSNNQQEVTIETDENGSVTEILQSEANSQDIFAHITIYTEDGSNITETVNIELRGITLLLSTDDYYLPADGTSFTTLTAQLFETTGGPVADALVEWNTTLGIINPTSYTNSSGLATTILQSQNQVTGNAVITASYGNTLTATATVTFTSN